MIAHWSFDSLDGGQYADDSGNGYAATVTTVGSGSAGIAAEAGAPFGGGARFNNPGGNQQSNYAYLSVPALQGLAGPAAGGFTVALWVNMPVGAGENTVLSDWGLYPARTEGNEFHAYWFTFQRAAGGLAPRGQLRNSDRTVGTGGVFPQVLGNYTDLVASISSGVGADSGSWHHVAWVWDKGAGEMRTYFDGDVVSAGQARTANRDVAVTGYPTAFIGLKQDTRTPFVGAMDELWVVGAALSAGEVQALRTTNAVPEAGVAVWFTVAAAAACGRRRKV